MSRRINYVVFIFFFATSLFGQEEGLNILFKQDFENSTVGSYQKDEWLRDWNSPTWNNRLSNAEIYNQAELSNVLKLTYKKGTVGLDEDSSPTPGNGIQFWSYHKKGQYTEMYLSYNAIFKEGFVYNLSGKLPGLLGGDQSYIPNTKPEYEDGWSCMVTWDGQVLNSSGQPIKYYTPTYPGLNDPSKGTINYYFYHQDQPNLSGDVAKWVDPYTEDASKPWYIIDNNTERWINITVRVVMNTIGPDGGNYDGIMEGFIDGKLMTSKTNIRWRNISSSTIDGILWSSFFGGSGDAFAAMRDEWSYFDDFYLFTYEDGVNVPRGNTPSAPGRTLQLPNLRYSEAPIVDPVDTEAPTAPTEVSISNVGENSLDLSWKASTDNVRVTGYNVYKGDFRLAFTNSTSFNVGELNPGIEYSFSVTAIDEKGNESTHSSPAVTTTRSLDTEAPSVPTGLRTTALTGYSIDITWDASTDNTGVAGYRVWLNGSEIGTSTNNIYAISSLSPNTNYALAIAAYDLAGNESQRTANLQVRTIAPDRQAPSVPSGLATTVVGETSVGLGWNASVDNIAVTGYLVTVNEIRQVRTYTNSITVTELSPGINYEFSVVAFDEASNVSASSEALKARTKNPDLTTEPSLPEIAILEINNKSNDAKAITELKSTGFTELEDFGMLISANREDIYAGEVLYAQPDAAVINCEGRVSKGLQVLYDFTEGQGNRILDKSNNREPLDLIIDKPLNTKWLPGQGLKVSDNTLISSEQPPTRIIEALSSSNEVTLEAWVRTSKVEQEGPARILSLSNGLLERAITLGQSGNTASFDYVIRLSTSSTGLNGIPEENTAEKFVVINLHHVTFTRDSQGNEKLFVNGFELYSGTRAGDFSSWDDNNQLVLANEITGDRPWEGSYYLVAVYDKALDTEEVQQNYQAGFGSIQFTSNLGDLEPNTPYYLLPFARTNQGMSYGDIEELTIENVIPSSMGDTLYMAVYPNPSDGNFMLHVEGGNLSGSEAYLRITNQSGQVVYNRDLPLAVMDTEVNQDFEIQLGSLLPGGFYTIILIVGNTTIARKLIIQK